MFKKSQSVPPFTFFGTMLLTGNFKKKIRKKFRFFFSIFSFLRALVVSSCRKSGFRVFLSLRYGADLGRSRLVVFSITGGGGCWLHSLVCGKPEHDTFRLVSPGYASGVALKDSGVIFGGDMTPEAALTKLSYVLAREGLSLDQRRQMMRENIRGELTVENVAHGEISLRHSVSVSFTMMMMMSHSIPIHFLFSAHISYGKGKYLNQTGFFYKICQELLFT